MQAITVNRRLLNPPSFRLARILHFTTTSFYLPFSHFTTSINQSILHLPQRCLRHHTQYLKKDLFPITIRVTREIYIGLETLTSAAAMVVSSAFVSYAGATSTISAETICRPSRPRKMVRNSRVDHPPVSGVPVAGANAGSIESIYVSSK